MRAHARILALDVGEKRIGLSVSDPAGITAQPAGFLIRSARIDEDIRKIREIAEKHEAKLIVVGLPKMLNGSSSPQTRKVEDFISELREHSDIPVKTWDERLTTTSAEASLIESGMRRKARRRVIDSVAAQIMLQHYLDCHRNQDISID